MAQFQPYVLQVHGPLNLKTGPWAGGWRGVPRTPEEADQQHEPLMGSAGEAGRMRALPRLGVWQIITAILSLLALALLLTMLFHGDGRINTWSNAKSMHFTRDRSTWAWVSIFPSQVYSNQQPAALAQWYRTVDGVLEKPALAADPAERHGFQIAGGFGILTNISSNVYLSALVVLYLLSTLDAAWLGVDSAAERLQKPVYFTWVTVTVGVLFVLIHTLQKFGTWHDVEWGADANKVSVRFSWEAGASLLYSTIVVGMYIIHVNVKNGVLHPLFAGVEVSSSSSSAASPKSAPHQHWLGTAEHGPVGHEASVIFAASFFLLVMGLLGDTRATVLETEAQLLILCAVGLSVLTLVSMRVRAYCTWVQEHFMRSKGDSPAYHEKQAAMIAFVLQLTDVITIAVSVVLAWLAFSVLGTMYDSADSNLLYVVTVVVTGSFLLIRAAELFTDLLARSSVASSIPSMRASVWPSAAFFAQYLLSVFVLLVVLFAFLFTANHGAENLRKLESMSYLGMRSGDVQLNTQCAANGVQHNKMLHEFLAVRDDATYDSVPLGTNNPVTFKVFAWTRWWQLELASTGGSQGPALYFCSTGLEQEFGRCAQQYALKPGKPFDETFQAFVDKAKTNNLVSA